MSSNPTYPGIAQDDPATKMPMAIAYVISLFATSIIFYFCNKRCSSAAGDRGEGSIHVVVQGDGLNAAAVSTLPLYTFAQLKPYKVGSAAAASGCAVCLGDFEDGESVRVLPECCHAFHRRCIDPWLKIHDTCPTCRKSTLPVAAATPLAAAPPAPVSNQ